MDDWLTLRSREYKAEQAWTCFQSWSQVKSRTTKSVRRKLEEDFILAIIPLLGCVLRQRFSTVPSVELDDICSEVSFRLVRKISRNFPRFRETGEPEAFTALLSVTIRNLVYDYLRCACAPALKVQSIPIELWYRRPQLSVPKAVELKLIMEELPECITEFAVKHDRFGFGARPIRAVARMLVSGKDVPVDLVQNWLGVLQAERCVAFVTLMARWYLHKYRDCFTPVLDGELAEYVVGIDQNCHVL